MSENKRIELLINITPIETRIASMEGAVLKEIYLERTTHRSVISNIYLGKVVRILPGMQAAFIDIGLEKTAFLHVSDMLSQSQPISETQQGKFSLIGISKRLQQGQFIVVQVIKESVGSKGARLTTDLTIPSRYLVFVPYSHQIDISQRIVCELERERLKNIVQDLIVEDGGFIIRTAAEGATSLELQQDANFLLSLWRKINKKYHQNSGKVTLLHAELTLTQRVLRDSVVESINSIKVDSKSTYELLLKFCIEFMPSLTNCLEHYVEAQPIFERYGVELGIQRALERKFPLKSGGYLIFDQTEAMTTIDINTGSFVGYRNLDETVFNINVEATKAIAEQLRLRNIGGIIIIDFIDMKIKEHREQTLLALERELSYDRVKTTFSGFSSLGLIEVTRKRVNESLEQMLCSECHICHGRGKIKNIETICSEIYREVVRVNLTYDSMGLMIYAAPEVVVALTSETSTVLADLSVLINKRIQLKVDALYTQEQFDVVMV